MLPGFTEEGAGGTDLKVVGAIRTVALGRR